MGGHWGWGWMFRHVDRVSLSLSLIFLCHTNPHTLLHTTPQPPPPQLSQSEFDAWFAGYQKASASIHGRADAMGAAAEKIEKDLVVGGFVCMCTCVCVCGILYCIVCVCIILYCCFVGCLGFG